MTEPHYTLTTAHFHAGTALEHVAKRLAAKLFKHDRSLKSLRLHIDRQPGSHGSSAFVATARVGRRGPDQVLHATESEPEKSLHEVLRKAERLSRERASARKHAARHPHAVELPTELPKT